MFSHLVAEVHARGRVSNLWDVEELEEVLHLDGHRAGSRPDQAHDGLLPLHQQAPCLGRAPALALLLLVGHQCVPDELDALLQRHRRVPARVPVQRGKKKKIGWVHTCSGRQHGNKEEDKPEWPTGRF